MRPWEGGSGRWRRRDRWNGHARACVPVTRCRKLECSCDMFCSVTRIMGVVGRTRYTRTIGTIFPELF